MQTPTTEPTRPAESLQDMLRKNYLRNHERMEDFPLFAEQFRKTKDYLAQNPTAVKQRVYYAHLLSEIGAAPLVVRQAAGLALLPEPIDAFLLYSLKVELKRVGETGAIAQYEPFASEGVMKYEHDTYVAHPCSPLPIHIPMTRVPKKHWWEIWPRYEPVKTVSRPATFGEIEFLAARLGEQKW